KAQWPGKRDWTYSREIDIAADFLENDSIILRLEDCDTFCTVTVNGEVAGVTSNRFMRYDFDVDSETLAKDAMEDERKILFVPGDYFDIPKTIRVGYGAFRDPEVLKAGLAQFSDYLKKWEK
ncbi:MAG: hypothetical protein IKN20_01815, partial [Firmicutes bacterium]|nr:hypothetical protein [Bacillota bacterium]